MSNELMNKLFETNGEESDSDEEDIDYKPEKEIPSGICTQFKSLSIISYLMNNVFTLQTTAVPTPKTRTEWRQLMAAKRKNIRKIAMK